MSTVIEIENLSKRYIIRHEDRAAYRTFRDAIWLGTKAAVSAPLTWLGVRPRRQSVSKEEFWALNEVSFNVQQGDRIGIIGRNGAGKSTLLKLLSRITEPTRGRIRITGRVASLLEVGTGFHPELTGRENIFLNGAVLGMKRSEIQQRFDAIVAFAEVERFLDTPVKRYSSGMYVRLAFAVAAHLEPEILIVDEVLAVGDAGFQKKCLGKMEEVSEEGRTVLFVSHSMTAISRLTNTCVLLEDGRVKSIGSTDAVTKQYFQAVGSKHTIGARQRIRKEHYLNRWQYSDEAQFEEIGVSEGASSEIYSDGTLVLDIVFRTTTALVGLQIGYGISADSHGALMLGFSPEFALGGAGRHQVTLTISGLNLAPGEYVLDLSIGTGCETIPRREYDVIQGIGRFSVRPTTKEGSHMEWSNGWARVIHRQSAIATLG